MEAIQVNVEFNNYFTDVVYEIINSVDLAVTSIENMQNIINNGVINVSNFRDARNEINQTTSAVDDLNAALQKQNNIDISTNLPVADASKTEGSSVEKSSESEKEENSSQKAKEKADSEVGSITKTVKKVISAFESDGIIGKVWSVSDSYSQAVSRLNMLHDEGMQITVGLVDMVYAAAQDTNTSFSKMVDTVALVNRNSGEAFDNQTEMVAFTDLIKKELSIEGLSETDASSVVAQLSQSLATGSLNSGALDSILKTAPEFAERIAIGLGTDTNGIKEMASQGILSADMIKAAFFTQSEAINNKFDDIPITWAGIWQSIQNSALMAFAPVLEQIMNIVDSDGFQEMITGIIDNMAALASGVLNIFSLIGKVGSFFSENWSIIGPIIMGIVTALGLFAAAMSISNILLGISAQVTAVKGAADAWARKEKFKDIVVQENLNAALLACPITKVVIGIIALIAVIMVVCSAIAKFTNIAESGLGVFCGAVAAAVSVIINMVIGLVNSIIQIGWTILEPIIGIIEWILNVMNGGFDSFGGAIANLLGTIISWFLSLGKIVTTIIDAIFGTKWTDGLDSLQDSVLSWGNNDKTIIFDRPEPLIDRIEYSDAFNVGAEFGDGISEKISNFNLSDLFGSTDVPNPEDYTKQFEDIYNSGNSQDLEDYLSQQEEIPDNVQGISDNTDNMADSMDIAEEDLKYLRDIAEQESVNRFTTAEISVDMSGMHNTVNNGMDLDGFVSSLTDAVNEAIDNMAEGVH